MSTRKIVRHVILLIVVLVAMSAIAIWLGLGPVVHSRADDRVPVILA